MDRAELQRRLLEANAVRPETHRVELVHLNETVTLRRPTKDQAASALVAAGDDLDQSWRMVINALRWMLVDDDGNVLLASYAEAAAFFNLLDDEDLGVLFAEVDRMVSAAVVESGGDGEAGKAS